MSVVGRVVRMGSSPHTRGAPACATSARRPSRIIPAYAGSTLLFSPSSRRKWDHPRIRGEHRIVTAVGDDDIGSSPHTRGAPVAELPALAQNRIIPAYAGSTSLVMRSCCLGRDHPRIRGEHDPSSGMSLQQMGSSPHTRGARRCRHSPRRSVSDHPRIRGEHPRSCSTVAVSLGSSPHTRGARQAILHVSSLARIIPAYAGSTSTASSRRCRQRDHPRIRGEHFTRRSTAGTTVGSSPHTRGARRRGR